MNHQTTLQQTIADMVDDNRGILAADESHPTMAKRFQAIGWTPAKKPDVPCAACAADLERQSGEYPRCTASLAETRQAQQSGAPGEICGRYGE